MQAARRLLSPLCVVAFAGLVLPACGGDEDPAATSGAQEASAPHAVDIADFDYEPETITVAAGETVTWTNSDRARHTATADDQAFDTGTLELDDAGEVTFDEPGSYPYFCRFHAFMTGTVEVE